MEARLTDLLGEAPVPVHPGAGSGDRLAIQRTVDNEPPHGRLLAKIDRYLRAAGAEEPSLRGRLMAAAARDLLSKGLIARADWAEIIAAIDRSLAEELATGGETLPRARGRVALRLSGAAGHGSASVSRPDWGAPPRRHQPMLPQDLARWRPTLDTLRRLHLSRPTQGLAAGLCWLAVLFVP